MGARYCKVVQVEGTQRPSNSLKVQQTGGAFRLAQLPPVFSRLLFRVSGLGKAEKDTCHVHGGLPPQRRTNLSRDRNASHFARAFRPLALPTPQKRGHAHWSHDCNGQLWFAMGPLGSGRGWLGLGNCGAQRGHQRGARGGGFARSPRDDGLALRAWSLTR